MFGGFNDPFFGDMNSRFAEMHNSMMRDFMMDPFGSSMFGNRSNRLALQGPTASSSSRNNQLARREDMMGGFGNNDPFSLMNSMMSNMNSIFGNMNSMMPRMQAEPNAQVYSSSTVMSYSNTGNGQPKVYQATTQTKQLPGGIRETKRSVRDSDKGVEKLSIGHHIGEKAHVVERQRLRDGQIEEVVNLENLDENEVNEFDKEFEQKVRQNYSKFSIDNHHRESFHRSHHNQPLAIDDGRKRDKKKSKSKH